jgi:UPF0271 protein
MRYILDATVIRSGMQISGQDEWFTAQSVMEELRKGRAAKNVGLLSDIYLKVLIPVKGGRVRVEAQARQTGDIDRLSDTDLDVLALALELEATIVSDDYSIQNVARCMNIKYISGIQSGIKEVYAWILRCKGCGRFYEKKIDNCPVCGSDLKTVRKK